MVASNEVQGKVSTVNSQVVVEQTLVMTATGGVFAGHVGNCSKSRGRMTKNRRISMFLPCLTSNSSLDSTSSEDNNIPGKSASDHLNKIAVREEAATAEEGAQDFTTNDPCSSTRLAIHTTIEYTHTLVRNLLDITNAPYYWGALNRYEAEALLAGRPEGSFLLRDSAQPAYLFSVSFRRHQRTLHARVEHADGRFSFDIHDKSVFASSKITELIAHYKDPNKCLFFEPQLSMPHPRSSPFPLQHICRAVIADSSNYESVGHLPIPRHLKQFLREYHQMQPVRVTRH